MLFCVLSCLAGSTVWAAPDLVTLRQLDFGVLAIRTNTASHAFTLLPSGLTSHDSAFVPVSVGAPGRYRLTGYPPFTDLSLNMSVSTISLANGTPGPILTASGAGTRPQTLRTDINGQVEFDLGATLTTSGSNQLYQDGIYAGLVGLAFSFDVAGATQNTNHAIEADLDLRSTLALAQVQPLAFGKLAVFSSATDQASLQLNPNGYTTVTNAGQARIVRFGNESLAVFKVSTGAAYAPVTITLPASQVYLVHESSSPDVARLLVSDFSTLPTSANAKLDALGQLEFRLGATLKTELTAKRYQDGLYTGQYEIEVTY